MPTVPIKVGARVVDQLGVETNAIAYANADTGQTIAQIQTGAQAWITALDNIIGGQITQAHVTIIPALPAGIKALPAGGSRVEQTAVLNFGNSVNTRRWGEAIPSILDSLLGAGGKLNLADPAVQAFITLMTGAAFGGTYSNPWTQAITTLIDAITSFRKRRKQLSRSSFEP